MGRLCLSSPIGSGNTFKMYKVWVRIPLQVPLINLYKRDNMNIRIFTRGELLDDLEVLDGDSEKVQRISETIIDHGRWTVTYELIFRIKAEQPEDEAWRVYYNIGATEHQDEVAWEYQTTVEATKVKKTQKLVDVWE